MQGDLENRNDFLQSLETRLSEYTGDFLQWAGGQKRIGEWETDYPEWDSIDALLEQLVRSTDFTRWSWRTVNNILYLVARDNECERLIDTLTGNPEAFICLAREGLRYPDDDARWQFAHHLSDIAGEYPEAEPIMLDYCTDTSEYVKRRALLALGYVKSVHAEAKAIEAWHSNLEYQKMAALETLYQVRSPQLDAYLEFGLNDKFKYVRENAERIKGIIHHF
ncbi:hypothetical protein QWJ34_14215 [Saccharibacillus sp. CPCC 101409]|uniref:HEAT repeat domain-containing protein n=1 Tax=Saccharibacillus sp. CPCC 101409 TaxID=3058041 RepID=UPI002670F7F1|nr:hypothetical protein [Saccharibacillus sp. CPCC 101409]MDO3410922.1 hypothetical protein [Saccharibacillus sp. CPCC 101409]